MSGEEKRQGKDIFWVFTVTLTLIFIISTSMTLMNFIAGAVHWNGAFGDIVNWWGINIVGDFEKLLHPFTNWIGWNVKWIAHYLLIGIFFYSLILCTSKLQSKWDSGTWISLAITWPLGVIAWLGMIALVIRTWLDDLGPNGNRRFACLVFSPFFIFLILLLANIWA